MAGISKRIRGSWVSSDYGVMESATDTITTLPADIFPNAATATVGLKGNTVQNGTPTPDNPVMPQGTGERTGNIVAAEADCTSPMHGLSVVWKKGGSEMIIDGKATGGDSARFTTFELDAGTYTLSITGLDETGLSKTGFYLSGVDTARVQGVRTYTITEPTIARLQFVVNVSDISYENRKVTIMFTKTSTALPYEPYGYKLDISSASTTTPIYLGEVESIRRIQKIIFTGSDSEGWTNQTLQRKLVSFPKPSGLPAGTARIISSHFVTVQTNNPAIGELYVGGSWINFNYDNVNDLDTWKAYLQQQYATGTPVTVWYVLTTPTTSIVNEPLMRIGDYADEISNITVPTTKGSNTLSVTTSVQPSNVQLSISGWVPHNNIKEYKNNAWMATSWEGFRDIVRAGNGPTRYPIGTKLYETWGDNTSNAWIIVDYDNSNYNDPDISALGYTHNVVLYEEKINYLKVFDNAEAWLYTETVLPAGTYRFTIPNYDATYGGNKTYIFTSTVDVPIHGQLTLSWPYQQNPVSVSAYTTNVSTTALFTATVSEWDGTTTSEDLGTIKLAMTDSDSTYGKLNHINRVRYGSNNYYQSGIRQWLNADATANNWWKPTNIFDRPYSNRTTDGGLYLMDKDFRKVIAAPNITCITNNIFETGASGSTAFKLQTQYTIRDKIFLPTHTELNLSSNPNIGTVFSQYTNAGNDDRIKYRKDSGNAYYYWFRTPYPSRGNTVWYVYSSGALSDNYAVNTSGAVRACIIQ